MFTGQIPPANDLRATAREIFLHSVKSASIESAFHRHVNYSRGVLRICDDLFNLEHYSRVVAISFGKAGHTMAAALREQLGTLVGGIVSAPEPPDKSQVAGFRYFHGGHPLPNAESIRAADAVLKTLSGLDEKSLVIYMISGGGSSIVEKPIDDEISLDDLISTYQVLVQSGAPIEEINVIRKHLSAVKGGRMAKRAAQRGAQQVSIMVSDVPENALDALASGPTMADSSSVEDCYAIAAKYGMVEKFPVSVRELFERRALEETPDKDDPLFHRSRWWPILSNSDALNAAAVKAAQAGFAVEIDNTCDGWDYADAADYLLKRLRELRRGASRVCLISGGEVTVRVGEEHGTGGRDQQFALYCATKIAAENITILSAGTDGIDGNSPAAGAVVDGNTLERFSLLGTGESLSSALKRFDAYPAFDKLGDAIMTRPTGNNVRDLRILMAY
ncbi:MAG: glycerate 2-kinase [Acidobacteriaceae bacterium]|nr:glycerate 2-kinase [Acidobacteriaceae bacterium]